MIHDSPSRSTSNGAPGPVKEMDVHDGKDVRSGEGWTGWRSPRGCGSCAYMYVSQLPSIQVRAAGALHGGRGQYASEDIRVRGATVW